MNFKKKKKKKLASESRKNVYVDQSQYLILK